MKIAFHSLIFLTLLFIKGNALADVRLWVSSNTTTGDLDSGSGARSGSDTFCNADPNKPAILNSTTRALISISNSDQLKDMDSNYQIPTNEIITRADGVTTVAANWAALLNTATTTLTNSIGAPGNQADAWSGSNGDGTAQSSNCLNYTSSNSTVFGSSGSTGATNRSAFLFNFPSCNTRLPLYCITYTEIEDIFCFATKTKNGKTAVICL